MSVISRVFLLQEFRSTGVFSDAIQEFRSTVFWYYVYLCVCLCVCVCNNLVKSS